MKPKKKFMRVLVFGGRDYKDKKAIHEVLDKFDADTILVHGDCPTGADAIAKAYAIEHEWIYWSFPAQWKRLQSSSAGPIRNIRMLKITKPHLGIGFPGGRGTRNMASLLEEAGVKVEKIGW